MTLFTPNYAFPFPELTDIPDGATETENLAIAVDTQMQANAATAAAASTRTALLAALLGTGVGIRSSQLTGTNTTSSTSNVTLTISATVAGHSFTVPTSGIVDFTWEAGIFTSVASGATAVIGLVVAQGSVVGSGTILSATTDATSFQVDGTQNTPGNKSRAVTGLTPGAACNCYLVWKITSGVQVATVFNPHVKSIPQFA